MEPFGEYSCNYFVIAKSITQIDGLYIVKGGGLI